MQYLQYCGNSWSMCFLHTYRKRSHRSRIHVGQDANNVDIMPPHVPITSMHLPSQRSGNDFFTI
eukprot:m.1366032 g.1366032  ORF g.1366032 m.1366032 type:complete len:64 (-) comp24951_c0_seq2:2651-2842(-)